MGRDVPDNDPRMSVVTGAVPGIGTEWPVRGVGPARSGTVTWRRSRGAGRCARGGSWAGRKVHGVRLVATLVLLLGLVACSGDGDDRSGAGRPADPTTASDPADPSPSDRSAPSDPSDLAATDVCRLVREGVDAFNTGDVETTIERFEAAVGPAEDLARDQPSDDTALLLEAVRYYASLPADDYVEANASSPEFARYRDFTLTACAYAGPPDDATTIDPGIPA